MLVIVVPLDETARWILALAWSRQVDDEQLIYLQNLILVSNDAVTKAFGVYEEDQDPVRLAESLKQVRVCACACMSESADRISTAV